MSDSDSPNRHFPFVSRLKSFFFGVAIFSLKKRRRVRICVLILLSPCLWLARCDVTHRGNPLPAPQGWLETVEATAGPARALSALAGVEQSRAGVFWGMGCTSVLACYSAEHIMAPLREAVICM